MSKNILGKLPCGCRASHKPGNWEIPKLCKLHTAAPELLAVAEEVLSSATIETPQMLLQMATNAIAKVKSR